MEKTSDIKDKFENKGNISFKVPSNYFDEFPMKIQLRISEDKKLPLFNRLFSEFKPQISLAFASIFIIVFSFVGYNIFFENNSDMQLISEDITEIIELQTNDIDEDLMLYALYEDAENEEFDNADLINYLIENGIDYDILYNEL
ncbi:MAG: hypothetical protein HN704_13665 [Bacteroidetes bacterium]|mgnify:CR=1 FL=1|jgi:hypothetical protein|nr:hypothetical protein [Bacteroidota bacterium]MBT6687071.1 hypothetical protein [Bacteroidota bacterium]MBT7142826.1 hypothetical protein [Bacteroidota bacterium]MBT7492643.1 hypothetical protein [Bacteroidota bacterium]